MTPEHTRLEEARSGAVPWKAWGPYLSERQWGTVREDYSGNGDAWNAFTHDEARGTPERWGTVPRVFIRTTEDRTIPLALQDRMIAEADAYTPHNRFEVHSLSSSHSPFASMPDRLAEVLAA